jgi:hypothetical protein
MAKRFYFLTSFIALLGLAVFGQVAYQHGNRELNGQTPASSAEAADQPSRVHVLAEHGAQITVGPNVQVSKPRAKIPHAEVTLAAHPSNPERLLAGSIIEQPGDGDSVLAYSSCDGGKTWELALEKKAAKGGPNFLDPAGAFGPDGSTYLAAICVNRAKQYLEIVSSRDGGKTWEAPIIKTERLTDRPFLAVDCTDSRFRGRVYCNCVLQLEATPTSKWEPAVFTSRDGGKTFDPPKYLVVKNGRSNARMGPSVVLSDGTLVVPYTVRTDEKAFGIRLRRSTTGGESFLDEQALLVRDFLGENTNVPYIPMLAVDPVSKAFTDHLYLVWAEKTPAGMQVMLTLSKDKGVTWSKPALLSEQPEPKEGAEGKSYHALLPSVAVNGAGVVGVSWYDTRDSREGKPNCNVRFRASLDGGATWLPSVRVTDAASNFSLNDKNGGVEGKNWVGHTAGLTADAAGEFHPLWVDNRTGVKQVFTARVAVRVIRPKK